MKRTRSLKRERKSEYESSLNRSRDFDHQIRFFSFLSLQKLTSPFSTSSLSSPLLSSPLSLSSSPSASSKMVSAAAFRYAVGIVGNVISFGLFLSPAPTFYKIIKNKSVEEFKADPYIATVLNCLFWIFYGMPFVHPDSLLVITINGVGLVMELIYLAIFFTYCDNKGRRKISLCLFVEIIFVGVIALITMLALHGTTKRSLMVGIICDVFNIIMYASPLTVMAKVIKTKSVKYMPFYLSLANFLNGSVWTAYALIKLDIYILISNGLGAISGLTQLVLYGYYYSSTPKDDEVVKPTEIQLSGAGRSSVV